MTPPDSPNGLDYLLTAKDVARLLKLSVRTVRRWAGDGRLPLPIRCNRFVRWRASDIQAYLANKGSNAAAQRTATGAGAH